METVLTSTALWKDFDPQAEPLEVNELKTEEKDGVITKTVYFTGRTVSDGKTRVLAKVCSKLGKGPRPAILLVDNYKKPIDGEELAFWAKNGFVAMAIDFAGRSSKGISTLYPSSLDYCNGDVAKSYFYVGTDTKQNKIYEYALNCMRAITYLLQEEKAKTVSVITVKKGVAVGIVVLGTDKRITNGAVIFGSLYREYPEYEGNTDATVGEMDEDELQKRLAYEQKKQMWTASIAPQSYASNTTVPVYLIVSASSPYVSSYNSNKMYCRMNENSRMLFLPLSLDYMSDTVVQNVVRWCKGTTTPEEAELSQVTLKGDNYIKVKTTLPHSKIDLWYSRNSGSRCRNWIKAPLKKVDDGFVAELDIYGPKSRVVAFAYIKSAVDITTPLCKAEIVSPSKVKIPTRSIFTCNNNCGGNNLIPLAKGDDWHGKRLNIVCTKGYLDICGAKSRSLATLALNDPSMRRHEIFTVSFDVSCNAPQILKVCAMSGFGTTNTEYYQSVQLAGDGKWQRITVEGANFHSDDGRIMPEDTVVELLSFVADDEFLINNIFLV